MKRLRTALQSKYLFKIITLITLIFSVTLTKLYPFQSIYTGDEIKFYGKVIAKKIDGDKLTILLKKKKNW